MSCGYKYKGKFYKTLSALKFAIKDDLIKNIMKGDTNTESSHPIYNSLIKYTGNKVQSNNVKINKQKIFNVKKGKIKPNPNEIITYRTRGNNLLEALEKDNAVGNPFASIRDENGEIRHSFKNNKAGDVVEYGNAKVILTDTIEKAVQNFIDWLTTDKFDNIKRLQQYKQSLLERIKSGELKNKDILYYKELNQPSHANALDYLINEYDWNNKEQQSSTQEIEQEQSKQVVNSYEGNIKPEKDTIFVFGSNPEGRHGAGAAKIALKQFDAKKGQGEGLQGNAYAIPTKDLSKAKKIKQYSRPEIKNFMENVLLPYYEKNGFDFSKVFDNEIERSISPQEILNSIKKLYEEARKNPDKKFKIAYGNTFEYSDKYGKDVSKGWSLNGYLQGELIEIFKRAGEIPSNVYFSKNWVDTGMFNAQSKQTNITEFTNHAGGAKGYDTIFKQTGKYKTNDITVKEYEKLSNKEKQELDKQYREAVKWLGRGILSESTYAGKLVRRDMIQANNADRIIAVTELVKPGIKGRKGYVNKTNHGIPEGGTGYAVARGVLTNKEVYVFNQEDKYGYEIGWYKWDSNKQDFVKSETPTMTKNFAGIGSSTNVTEEGKQAVKNVYEKTLKELGHIQPKVGFKVTPLPYVPEAEKKKSKLKASKATAYIGFGNRSTKQYGENAKEQGIPVNKENYNENDVVFVSVNGNVIQENLNKTIDLAVKALEVGATLLTDSEEYLSTSNYNKGEKLLAQELLKRGYKRTTLSENKNVAEWSTQSSKTVKYSEDINTSNIEKHVNYRNVIGDTYEFTIKGNKLKVQFRDTLPSLAATDGNILKIRKGITKQLVIDYLNPNNPNPTKTQKVKIEVNKRMKQQGIDLVKILNQMSDKQIKYFLLAHEFIHTIQVKEEGGKENLVKKYKQDPVKYEMDANIRALEMLDIISKEGVVEEQNIDTSNLKSITLPKDSVSKWSFDIDMSNGKVYNKNTGKEVNVQKYINLAHLKSGYVKFRQIVLKINGKIQKYAVTDNNKIINITPGSKSAGNEISQTSSLARKIFELINPTQPPVIQQQETIEETKQENATPTDITNPLEDNKTSKQKTLINPVTLQKYELAPGMYANEQQIKAINDAVEYLLGNSNEVFVIEGKGGTGKTTIINKIIEIHRKKEKGKYVTGALSNKATNVIADKVKGASSMTIAKMLGLKMDASTGIFYQDFENSDGLQIGPGNIVIVDEASMVNEEMYQKLKETGAKIIYLGDNGQLPPIREVPSYYYLIKELKESGEVNISDIDFETVKKAFEQTLRIIEKIGHINAQDRKILLNATKNIQPIIQKYKLDNYDSPVFRNRDRRSAMLTQRVRQGNESPILPYSDYYWENSQKEKPVTNPVKEKKTVISDKGTLQFSSRMGSLDTIVEEIKKGMIEGDSNRIKVVAYRNATVDWWNRNIRKKLGFGDKYIKGEPLILNKAYSPTKSQHYNNGTELTVIEDYGERQIPLAQKPGHHIIIRSVGVEFINEQGDKEKQEFKIIDKRSEETLKQYINFLWDRYFKIKNTNRGEAFEIRTEAIELGSKYAYVSFAYAITSHKSQGSTYNTSVADESDIMSVTPINNKQKSQSMYVAISRARNNVIVIDGSGTKINSETMIQPKKVNLDNSDNNSNFEPFGINIKCE